MNITSLLAQYLRINRIRLEFKVVLDNVVRFLPRGINRIRLEFKVDVAADDTCGIPVLIESDWNLKWKEWADQGHITLY